MSKLVALGVVWIGLAICAGCDVADVPADQLQPGPEVATAAPASSDPDLARGKLDFIAGYAAGRELARREARPMLVFFTATWCHFCHQMAREALTDDQVVNLSQRFVCVLVDADEEAAVCRQFRIRAYPTILFLSPQGAALNRVTGKRPPYQLIAEMHAALQAIARAPDADTRRL